MVTGEGQLLWNNLVVLLFHLKRFFSSGGLLVGLRLAAATALDLAALWGSILLKEIKPFTRYN